jgi:hypothetical protein
MGKMFGNLTDTTKLETSEDRLGGGFEPLASGAYTGTIKLAYAGKAAQSDAQNVTIHVDVNGKEFRETIYITNRKGENFYADKQDPSKKMPLPGFTTVDDICLLTTGEGLIDQETEEKVVKLYNFQERKEVNTPTQCLTALHGKTIRLGILREIVDKEAKDASGNYVPTGETRTQNTIDKVFHPETNMTVNEYRNELSAPEFHDAWVKKNEGQDRNKAKGAAAGGAGAAGIGRPPVAGAAGGAQPEKKKLFGK